MPDIDSRPAVPTVARIPRRLLLRLKSWLPIRTAQVSPIVVGTLVLPVTVGEIAGSELRVLCLGPTEWLLVAEPEAMTGAGDQALEHELAERGVAMVDVSQSLVGFTLQGAAVREILSMGCGIDVHPSTFPAGRCVRARLAQIPAVIAHVECTTRYELYVARSHATYFSAWLDDAAVQWGVSAA